MCATSLLGLLLIGGGVVFFIARQLRPRRVTRATLVLLPAGLAYLAWHSAPAAVSPSQSLELIASVAVGMAGGFWQAAATHVFEKDGAWWVRGGWGYLLAWACILAARLFLRFAFEGPAGLSGPAALSTLWMTYADVAAAWGMRSLVVYLRHPQIGAGLMVRG